jgi:uncharacterized protein YegP (UPF0339 family)
MRRWRVPEGFTEDRVSAGSSHPVRFTIEVYYRPGNGWRLRLRGRNGEIVLSGEFYTTKAQALRTARILHDGMTRVVVQDVKRPPRPRPPRRKPTAPRPAAVAAGFTSPVDESPAPSNPTPSPAA